MKQLINDRRVLLPLVLTAIVIAVGAFLIVLLSDDASGGASTAAAAPPSTKGGTVKVDIADFKFGPETITVKAGGKVSWINEDAAPHTATARGILDTGTLKKGERKTLTLKKPGTYAYICELHPFMRATVIVR